MPPLNTLNKSLVALAITNSVFGQPAHAATITVNTTDDVIASDSNCSLREAIISANTDPGNTLSGCVSGQPDLDTIKFAFSAQTYGLSAPLVISSPLYIDGSAAVIDAQSNSRVFDILNTSLGLYNLDVINGAAIGDDQQGNGGGITASNAQITLNDVEFRDNQAEILGAAVYLDSGSVMTVTNSNFSNNSSSDADGSGGAIFLRGSSLSIESSTLSSNSVRSLGGAIAGTDGSSIEIIECAFRNNDGGVAGGGVFVGNGGTVSQVKISKSLFENNVAQYGGGFYFNDYAKAMVSDSTVASNTATYGGGGVYLYGSSDTSIINTTIFGNIAQAIVPGTYTFGGGISIGSSQAKLRLVNSTITGNSAVVSGGGLAAQFSAKATVVNTIISGNTADISAQEVYVRNDAEVTSRSNILGSNNSTSAAAFDSADMTANFVPSASDIVATSDNGNFPLGDIIQGAPSSLGNLRFYRLPFESPAISAASSSACPPRDAVGEEREQDGLFVLKTKNDKAAVIILDGDCDVGAVEFIDL